MARKIRKTREAGKIFIPDPAELNRWCIEMAMRWPSHEVGGYGGGAMVGGYQPSTQRQRVEEDVIGRAKKIRDWVTATG